MSDQATRRVRALGDGKLPFVDASGIHHKGRFAGRDVDGKPIVEDVPDTVYYRKALRIGSIEDCTGKPTTAEVAHLESAVDDGSTLHALGITAHAGDLAADVAAGGAPLLATTATAAPVAEGTGEV